jgi:hypothetical protein
MHQSGLLQILYKKNLQHRSVEAAHEFSKVSISQVTPIVAALAMGLITAILVLVCERRLKYRSRDVATVDGQDPYRGLCIAEALLSV